MQGEQAQAHPWATGTPGYLWASEAPSAAHSVECHLQGLLSHQQHMPTPLSQREQDLGTHS